MLRGVEVRQVQIAESLAAAAGGQGEDDGGEIPQAQGAGGAAGLGLGHAGSAGVEQGDGFLLGEMILRHR